MTTQTTSLSDFLLARIAEDEEDAEETRHQLDVMDARACSERPSVVHVMGMTFPHPARLAAECEAKRRIVEEAWKTEVAIESEYGQGRSRRELSARGINPVVIELLALPYADHPDYRAEWGA